MEPINDSKQLDQILLQAHNISQPILIDWMTARCRKCIHLKPKLEKLAAEYDTKIKFYSVDVNKKMPTIQLVIEQVREIIQKFI
ncbi:hypothetical protein P3X46_009333 [Hevea brasiliensis]|uniref:Thioredoxin domain-containing protein n=1 Tax=Hevea brasiliensis TaxID=3981 RepID=A0ABQ9MQL6_HEVBR|nr:hypothetical protein P3X46_009333 [Hevea brasiliensis]